MTNPTDTQPAGNTEIEDLLGQLFDALARSDAALAKLNAIEALIDPSNTVVESRHLREVLDRDDAASPVTHEWKVWIKDNEYSEAHDYAIFHNEEDAFRSACSNKEWASTMPREVAVRRLYAPAPWQKVTNGPEPTTGTRLA